MEDIESDSSGPDKNPWPHLTEYVELVSKSGQQLLFACRRCLPKDTKINVHFEEIVKAGSSRGEIKRTTHSDNIKHIDDSTSSSDPNPVERIRQVRWKAEHRRIV
ncbi:hypothetical protein WA026_007579 [Henosepilachna vigintioctopunctata]|uniref:Uncharacterized protein n=1 Tax=Henosepilachna vigintioctopunctata TaxID=420089 RepID=A0AAW1UNL1_9CUCU